jgi:hypothetical protein
MYSYDRRIANDRLNQVKQWMKLGEPYFKASDTSYDGRWIVYHADKGDLSVTASLNSVDSFLKGRASLKVAYHVEDEEDSHLKGWERTLPIRSEEQLARELKEAHKGFLRWATQHRRVF